MDRCLIIKVGSSLIADRSNLTINKIFINNLLADVAVLAKQDYRIIIVSSGAVALGIPNIIQNYAHNTELSLVQQQAAAACGQPLLLAIYSSMANIFGIKLAQILLTYDDITNGNRSINAKNTLNTLLQANIIPVINENDTVATDELKFGDNDKLAAHLVNLLNIKQLFLLTNVDGLYTSNPEKKGAKHISSIDNAKQHYSLANGKSNIGRGGMLSKLQAASIAQSQGCEVYISNGNQNQPISNILNDNCLYTLCKAL